MKNATLAIFALIFLITVASASDLRKRTCTNSKRGVLGKRNPEKCPCQLAFADFTNEGGVIGGYVVYAQDECGETTVTGIFTKGITPNTTFAIVDDCGRKIQNLGNLGIEVADNSGSTKSFRQKFEFDLNCTNQGVFNVKPSDYRKRTCNSKRQDPESGGTGTHMETNDAPPGSAPIYTP